MTAPKKEKTMSVQYAWCYCVTAALVTVLIIYFNSYYGGHH